MSYCCDSNSRSLGSSATAFNAGGDVGIDGFRGFGAEGILIGRRRDLDRRDPLFEEPRRIDFHGREVRGELRCGFRCETFRRPTGLRCALLGIIQAVRRLESLGVAIIRDNASS